MIRPIERSQVADACVVVTICFGWFILASIGAVAAGFPTRPFDNSTFTAIIVLEVILGTIALIYLHRRGHDLSPLVPTPTGIGCVVGLGLYIVVSVANRLVYLLLGRPDLNTQPIEQMVGGASITVPWLIVASIVNGFYEETFLVGYLLRELGGLGPSFAVGVTVLVRVLYHLYQGPLGASNVVVFGVVIGIYYWRTKKLWPVVFAHLFADIAAFMLR